MSWAHSDKGTCQFPCNMSKSLRSWIWQPLPDRYNCPFLAKGTSLVLLGSVTPENSLSCNSADFGWDYCFPVECWTKLKKKKHRAVKNSLCVSCCLFLHYALHLKYFGSHLVVRGLCHQNPRPLHVFDVIALLSPMYLQVSPTKDNYISNLPAPYIWTQTGELTEHPGNTTDSNQALVPYLPPVLEPVGNSCQ